MPALDTGAGTGAPYKGSGPSKVTVQGYATQRHYFWFLRCAGGVCKVIAPPLPCKLKADALASSCAEEVLLPVHVSWLLAACLLKEMFHPACKTNQRANAPKRLRR